MAHAVVMLVVVVWVACLLASCHALRGGQRPVNFAPLRSKGLRQRIDLRALNFRDLESTSTEDAVKKPILIEIVTKQQVQESRLSSVQRKEVDGETRIVGAYTVYKEEKGTRDRIVDAVSDSPIVKVFGIFFNPTSLLLVLYFSSIGWSQVRWLQNFLKLFGRGSLAKKPGEKGYTQPTEELPFQTFECEKCKMEMRPARGRADAIFGRERFRCSRCGSKAAAYFNVDDLNDPRAVARLERIKKEKEEEGLGEDEGDGDDPDGVEDDE